MTKLHASPSQGLATGDIDGNRKDELLVDFGSGGLWARYNNTSWVKLHGHSPVHTTVGDLDGDGKDEAVADFGAAGIWVRYNNAAPWVRLHTWPEQAMAAGSFD